MALSGDSRTRAQIDAEDFPVTHVPPPYAYRCPYGSSSDDECGRRAAERVGQAIDDFAESGEANGGGVAAVLMEPDAGTNGIVPPDSFWPRLRAVTRERGVALIADEVMSGFGRCGEWFAWQRHGEAGRPDLMTLAKGLTGAHLPLGAVVLAAGIARRLETEMLWTGLTYCGHPLACAAGVAALRAYEEEGLVERSRRLGAGLLAELEAMKARHPSIGDVRGGRGLFAVVELVRDRATREPLSPWPDLAPALRRLAKRAYDEGVSLAVRGNLLLLAPPLVIEEAELAKGLAVVDRLLGELDGEVSEAIEPPAAPLPERRLAEGRGA
jgi:taurine--2-oxoglutarate transaminase